MTPLQVRAVLHAPVGDPAYDADVAVPELDPRFELDLEDRITILQLLTLSPSDRLQYLLDELAFDDAVGTDPVDG